MSTWQILSDAGNDFRWEISGRIVRSEPDYGADGASSPPLPSMADLLLRVNSGYTKLVENGGGGDGKAPMFRTGLGMSMALKESSIAKALSILGDDVEAPVVSGEVLPRNDACGYSNSFFQTGSGKRVNVSSAGLARARSLFGLDGDNELDGFQGFQQPWKSSATNELRGWQSLSHMEKKDGTQSTTFVDSASDLRQSPNSKADFVPGSKLSNEDDSTPMHSRMLGPVPRPPPMKFHTASGKSLSVSSDALKRARSLLGDPELGTFFDEVDAGDPSFSFPKQRRFDDTSSMKQNDFYSSISDQGTIENKHTSKSFISSQKSSFKQTRCLVNSGKIMSGCNLIEKFDEVGNASAGSLTKAMPSVHKKPLERNLLSSSSSPTRVDSRNKSLGRSSGGPLTDISNSIPVAHSNNNQLMSEKRRIGRTNSISAFKKPRSSRFSTPLNRDVPLASNGLSALSSERSCYKRTVSTRYPFQIPRVYVREYFGMPPSACSMVGPLSDDVKWIKPANAEKYTFKDESGLQCIGAEAFYDLLSRSGASMQYVSKE